jgi:hypothetical protein
MTTPKRRTVGILICDDVEVLDFCGPFEAFSVARPVGVHDDEARLFDAVTVAETAAVVSARHGLEGVDRQRWAASVMRRGERSHVRVTSDTSAPCRGV